MNDTKGPILTELLVKYADKTVHVPMRKLLEVLKLPSNYLQAGVAVKQDGTCLTALTDIEPSGEYPGIVVDGHDANGEKIYVARAELPSEDFPNAVTAMLYAGYENYETNEPVAVVRTSLMSREELNAAAQSGSGLPRKIVYINDDVACSRSDKHGIDQEHDG